MLTPEQRHQLAARFMESQSATQTRINVLKSEVFEAFDIADAQIEAVAAACMATLPTGLTDDQKRSVFYAVLEARLNG